MDIAKNFAKGTLSAGYGAGDVAITLLAGQGLRFPAAPFNAVWWNATDYPDPADDPAVEIVRVTAVAGDVLTIARGQEGTTASAKNTAAKSYKICQALTAKWLNTDLPADIAAAGSGSGVLTNAGAPEGAVTADVGQLLWDTSGEALYVKRTGSGNTGWMQLVG